MSVYTKLYEETQHQYEEIGRMELGSDEHVKTVNCANSMTDRLLDRDRLLLEERKLDIEERKLELEQEKLQNERRGKWLPHVITVVTTGLCIGTQVWTVLSERKFEAKGLMLTSEAGRSSRRSLLSLVDKFRK